MQLQCGHNQIQFQTVSILLGNGYSLQDFLMPLFHILGTHIIGDHIVTVSELAVANIIHYVVTVFTFDDTGIVSFTLGINCPASEVGNQRGVLVNVFNKTAVRSGALVGGVLLD